MNYLLVVQVFVRTPTGSLLDGNQQEGQDTHVSHGKTLVIFQLRAFPANHDNK